MKVKVLEEHGIWCALHGIGLSYGLTSFDTLTLNDELLDRLSKVSEKLAPKGDGHNKFLEFIDVFVLIRAPRYWWSQFDTYRVGITKQSESTMHTILKTPFTVESFQCLMGDEPISQHTLDRLNSLRERKNWRQLKIELPESYLQTRIVKLSYMNIKNIVRQRKSHKLIEWQMFINQLVAQLNYKNYLEVFGEPVEIQ